MSGPRRVVSFLEDEEFKETPKKNAYIRKQTPKLNHSFNKNNTKNIEDAQEYVSGLFRRIRDEEGESD